MAPKDPSTPNVRSVFNVLAIGCTISGVGVGMLLAGWQPEVGIGLIAAGTPALPLRSVQGQGSARRAKYVRPYTLFFGTPFVWQSAHFTV